MLDIIGVPYDLGGIQGARLGPKVLRMGGLHEVLKSLHIKYHDRGDVKVNQADLYDQSMVKALKENVTHLYDLKKQVKDALNQEHSVLVLGGDHSLSIGSISAALDLFGDKLAVLWIDAHADFNIPLESPSGNLHGMPLAALMGFGSGEIGEKNKQWSWIQNKVLKNHFLKPEQLAWIGLRAVDEPEERRLKQIEPGLAIYSKDIHQLEISSVVKKLRNWIKGNKFSALWVSFDLDSLDPQLCPGVGTSEEDGLTHEQAFELARALHQLYDQRDNEISFAGMDIVEMNPVYDVNSQTAKMALEWCRWILSGK